MLTSFSSNAITAKARAIYGKRLTTADYRELMRQRTVSDVASYLKNNTCYKSYFSGIDEMQVHRGQLEVLLQRSKLEKFVALCHYNFSGNSDFYEYASMNVEVDVLLRAVMLLNSHAQEDIITNLPTFMQPYVSFDFIKLSKVTDFTALLAVVAGTSYQPVLKPFEAENGSIDLTGCELALKTHYYQTVFRLIDKNYSGKVRRELNDAVMTEIELENLAMIYRLKRYFHRSALQIKQQLLPFYKKLTPRVIDALIEPENDKDFVDRMRLSSYNRKMHEIPFEYVEDYTKRLKFLITRKLMHFSASAPIAFYSLMTLTQIEIDDLTTIIEGIRYSVAPSEIEKLLILE